MKRKLMFKSILSIAFLSNAFVSYAEADFVSDGIYYNIVDGGCEVTYYESKNGYIGDYSGDIVIPMTANGYTVVGIGESAFEGDWELKTVLMPPSITYIGNEAFSGSSLTSIDIPASVTVVGISAFQSCSRLESVTFSGSVEEIGREAFYSCRNLESVTFSGDVGEIGEEAFYSCSNLKSVAFGGSVGEIGELVLGLHCFDFN